MSVSVLVCFCACLFLRVCFCVSVSACLSLREVNLKFEYSDNNDDFFKLFEIHFFVNKKNINKFRGKL